MEIYFMIAYIFNYVNPIREPKETCGLANNTKMTSNYSLVNSATICI